MPEYLKTKVKIAHHDLGLAAYLLENYYSPTTIIIEIQANYIEVSMWVYV